MLLNCTWGCADGKWLMPCSSVSLSNTSNAYLVPVFYGFWVNYKMYLTLDGHICIQVLHTLVSSRMIDTYIFAELYVSNRKYKCNLPVHVDSNSISYLCNTWCQHLWQSILQHWLLVTGQLLKRCYQQLIYKSVGDEGWSPVILIHWEYLLIPLKWYWK